LKKSLKCRICNGAKTEEESKEIINRIEQEVNNIQIESKHYKELKERLRGDKLM